MNTTAEAFTVGVALVPLYIVVRDTLKTFKVNNDTITVCLTGVIAFEVAEYSGVLEWYAYRKLHASKKNARPPPAHPRICPLAMELAYR